MEVLATQYKALMNPNLPDSIKNLKTVKQYLDPYDGDLESTSSESDCSRSVLLDGYIEKINYQSHAIVAIDGRKLPIKPYKQSLQMTFETVCSYTELNSTKMEPVPTADALLQSSSESEVLSNRVHDLTFPTNRLFSNTKQKQFESLDLEVLTSPVNSDIGEHGFMSMLALQSPGKCDSGHQNTQLCSGRILKASHERFHEGKRTPKRKLGNPLIDTGNDRMNKKKSRMNKN
ncbi:uncharacterized protein [Heterodontus francisci]|uniref:uncharacterized protein isoform X2 n=1 Tax=Heterodontus francisci TaxID=7792 RepID=UPI00355BFA41